MNRYQHDPSISIAAAALALSGIEINPLLASSRAAIALSIRMTLCDPHQPAASWPKLVIRPYYVMQGICRNLGFEVTHDTLRDVFRAEIELQRH